MNKRYKMLAIVCAVVLFGTIAVSVVMAFMNGAKTSSLNIQIAPSGSSAKLNGSGVKPGIIRVKPGSYTLTASKDGFKEESLKIVVKSKETRFTGIALTSNSESTKDWYQNNPQDQALREAVIGGMGEQNSKDAVSQNPLLDKLPFIGAGFSFRIYSGISQKGSDQPAIYIKHKTEEGKNDALQWIKNSGFDPNKMEIIYLLDAPYVQPGSQTSGSVPDSE